MSLGHFEDILIHRNNAIKGSFADVYTILRQKTQSLIVVDISNKSIEF